VGEYSYNQLRSLAQQAGFTGANSDIAAAIAMAESGGNPNAIGDNGTSFGLWQIHLPAHPDISQADATNPLTAAQAAFRISNGGTNFRPWSTYLNSAYQKFLGGNTLPVVPTQNYNQSSQEYGIDAGVQSGVMAGNNAYAPMNGKIIGMDPSGWPPLGRLLIQTPQGILGIGHIIPNANLHVGDTVNTGDVLGQFTNVYENGPQGPMFEVMFDPGSTNKNDPRSAFMKTPIPTLESLASGVINSGKGITPSLTTGTGGTYTTTGQYTTLNQAVQNAITNGGFGSSVTGPIVGFFAWASQPFLLKRIGFTLAGLSMIFIGVRLLTNRSPVPPIPSLPDMPEMPERAAIKEGAKVVPVSQARDHHASEKAPSPASSYQRVEPAEGPSTVHLDEGPGVTYGGTPPGSGKKPPRQKPVPEGMTRGTLPSSPAPVKKISRAKLREAGYKP
jgi:hypothetical protein